MGLPRGKQKENAKISAETIKDRINKVSQQQSQTGTRAAGQGKPAAPLTQIGGSQPVQQAGPAAEMSPQFHMPWFAPFGMSSQLLHGFFSGEPGMAPLGMFQPGLAAPFPG